MDKEDQNLTEIFSAFYFINQSFKPIFANLVSTNKRKDIQ